MSADPALEKQLAAMLSKAERSLRAAHAHADEKDFDFAASRAYYAVFYAIEAALLSVNVTCSTHSGAISAFSKHFVKTGIFPAEFGTAVARLFRERQIGDYDFDVSVSGVDAEEDVKAAERILVAVKNRLKI